jgi:Coenzyme PQQ synthesis protein D (PqqD)
VNQDVTVARRAALLESEVDGEIVALHVDNGTCYGFNGTASRIWAMLETPKRLSEIRDAMLAEFDVDAATCEAEVTALVRELEADGLVELQPVSPAP